jgi:hypothetical protein
MSMMLGARHASVLGLCRLGRGPDDWGKDLGLRESGVKRVKSQLRSRAHSYGIRNGAKAQIPRGEFRDTRVYKPEVACGYKPDSCVSVNPNLRVYKPEVAAALACL